MCLSAGKGVKHEEEKETLKAGQRTTKALNLNKHRAPSLPSHPAYEQEIKRAFQVFSACST